MILLKRVSDERERALLKALQRGERPALHRVIQQYASRMYCVSALYLNDEGAAQTHTEAVLAGARPDEGTDSVYVWLMSQLYRELRAWEIDRGVTVMTELDVANAEQPPSLSVVQVKRGRLKAALQTLSPDLRLTFLLAQVDGASYDHIARITGVSPGQVHSRLNQARKQLYPWLLYAGVLRRSGC
ncbi:MAG: hypothetical protein HYV27_03875 [Candidatus Hydrogenedentes bacterium]|nr:hypothetical protein [Candidatus Hydrogenedentota bacterium]